MPSEPDNELTLVTALNHVTSADDEPVPITEPTSNPATQTDTGSAKLAFRRCYVAWQRAFKAYMDDHEGDAGGDTDIYLASKVAGPAFCNAMPILAGPDGIRDFLACAAHGIAIDAVSLEKGAYLLYAAQIAANLASPGTRLQKLPQARKTNSR